MGKTTTAANLAAGIARSGKTRVLVVDADPQANLTATLFPHERRDYKGQTTLAQVMADKALLDEAIVETTTKHLDLIPSHIDLFEQEGYIQNTPRALLGFDAAFKKSALLSGYDIVLIDCPPNLGTFMSNSLYAANYVIVPVAAGDKYALDGLRSLQNKITQVNVVKTEPGKKTELLGYLLTRCDMRTNVAKTIVKSLRDTFGPSVFKTVIRENTEFGKAIMFNKTIFQQELRASGAEDYGSLAAEVLTRIANMSKKVAASEVEPVVGEAQPVAALEVR
ncbi:MAG: ParA family protein [Nitrospira sp.]|nr:ParA family protein [Nitrospira sp.]